MMKMTHRQASSRMSALFMALVFVAVLAVPNMLFAQTFEGADQRVCGFFDDVRGLLNMASVAIVTIAVIIAGYQIAFAHKRISDVAPILIGGLLIGAASQIAGMLLLGDGATADADCTAMLVNALPIVA
ncbi:MAG: TrbC/VirB2 family protein [Pseudomonadota bacterium]